MGNITSKSKIVPISRFDTSSPRSPDFISGTYDSEIIIYHKGAKNRKPAKPQSWLIKKPKHAQEFTPDQQFAYAIKNRCEVFSAWQYESFIGPLQPKYYLLRDSRGIESIASKLVPGYTSMNQLINTKRDEEKAILLQPKNLKLFAQMLVNFVWLAASDFKLDHLGIDSYGNLVCLDFGESLIPFQYQERVYTSRGWNFSITPQDLLTAPFFTTYQSSNFFIERATSTFPGIFDFLQDNPDLKHQLCIAILKRCIFPNYISFAALELFHDFEACVVELQEFMTKRTAELCLAATQSPIFSEFMRNHGEEAYEEIKVELLSEASSSRRYFRNNQKMYHDRCLEELRFNFRKLATDIQLTRIEKTQPEAVKIIRMLREFCEKQYLRLQKTNENAFFKKGLSDKTYLFKRLLDKIDEVPIAELAETALVNFINRLIKEIAIVAHHRRYSKINTLFGHKESASWNELTTFFSSYAGDYSSVMQQALANKSSRSIAMIDKEELINGYNEYRHAIKARLL